MLLAYEERRYGGGVVAGQENESWPDHEDEEIEFTPIAVFASRENSPWLVQSFQADRHIPAGDQVHLVIVRYGDGGTFGKCAGYWQILGAFADHAAAKQLAADVYGGRFEGYKPWDGYFSWFISCDVHTFTVQP